MSVDARHPKAFKALSEEVGKLLLLGTGVILTPSPALGTLEVLQLHQDFIFKTHKQNDKRNCRPDRWSMSHTKRVVYVFEEMNASVSANQCGIKENTTQV